jgi:hypothetical protein
LVIPKAIHNNQLIIDNNNIQTFKTGIDVTAGSKNTFGILFFGNIGNLKNTITNNTAIGIDPLSPDSVLKLNSSSKNTYFNPSLNLYFKRAIDTLGSTLTVNADYWNYNQNFLSNYENLFFDGSNPSNDKLSFFKNMLPSKNIIKSFSSDYSKHFKYSEFLLGGKVLLIDKDNDFTWEDFVNNEYLYNSSRSNHFKYSENIFAAYAGFKSNIKKFSYQVITRFEQADISSNSLSTGQKNDQNYLKVFPSVNLQYAVSDKNQVNFSFRKSITRPQFDYLDPFLIFIDQFNYFRGNPNLKPQISNSYEFSYSYNQELFLTGSYTNIKNGFSSIYLKNKGTNYLTSSYENLAHFDNFSFNLNYNKKVIKKLMTFLNASVFYNKVNTNLGDSLINNRGLGLLISDYNTYSLPKNMTATLFFAYSSPYKGTIYYYKSSGFVDVGLNIPAFKKHGNINITASDIFKTTRSSYYSRQGDIDFTYKRQPDSRRFSLAISYRFGGKDIRSNDDRPTGIEKEKDRMKTSKSN